MKVEGAASAIITDIAVELLPNADIFDEVYPPSELSDYESDSESDDEDPKFSQAESLERAYAKITAIVDDITKADERIDSANSMLSILNAHAAVFTDQRNLDVHDVLSTYRAVREKVFEDRQAGLATKRDLEKRVSKLRREHEKLQKCEVRERRGFDRERQKRRVEREARRRVRETKRGVRAEERARVRREREDFWPKYVYAVTVSLDATAYTPISSSRGSISSDAGVQIPRDAPLTPGKEASPSNVDSKCDLLLTYVTSSAFWSPTYDLQLSTTTSSATLTYEARLTNTTSETWSSAHVTLSTSQTTFSGLDDALPTLSPWRIKLSGRHGNFGMSVGGVVASRDEETYQMQWEVQRQQKEKQQKPRSHLFGVQKEGEVVQSALQVRQGVEKVQKAQAEYVQKKVMLNRVTERGQRLDSLRVARREESDVVTEEMDYEAESVATVLEALPELDFQDSAMEETGLTTTYDLPGLKTLAPRPRAMKQRIARIPLPNVVFSHTVVAKYKPVAYLKARLRNASRLALPRGPAGLTLDGSFLGRTSLPRCSAGDSFFLSLGIDPDLRVTYPRPKVRRSTSGFLSKEDGAVYVRAVTLVNTRAAGGDAIIYVLDQVPVSEDEKLRVDVLTPRGMGTSGGVSTGVPTSGAENEDWGTAVASLRKEGEVEWGVTLKAGKGVRLGLEYEVSAPAGDKVMEC